MRVEIWSDIVCPWCYIGKRRFETALARFEHGNDVEVLWRSFELDPSAPRRNELPAAEHLAKKYGTPIEEARAKHARLTSLAAAEGLDFHLGETARGNSFDAHRLIHLAAESGATQSGAARSGLQDAMKERLLLAYFTEGEAIGEPDVLLRLAVETGLDADEVGELLAGDAYAADVRADENRAQLYGITGVPFFVLDERYGISGAQPSDVFLAGLEHVGGLTPRKQSLDLSLGSAGSDPENTARPASPS